MLTARGFWFFVTNLFLLGLGIGFRSAPAVLVCLTLVLWFLAQWFLFHWRLQAVRRHLLVSRSLLTGRGEVDSIWARQQVQVRVAVSCEGPNSLPFVVVSDRVPSTARWRSGVTQAEGVLAPDSPLELSYAIECPRPGRIRFDGARVELSDLGGFFYEALFVRDVCQYRVLPALPADPAHSTYVKVQNTIPLLGTHRHPRVGSGSELLDLRDYLSGDPPKMIAWKVSARRDRLMTRELESEVPIRCTLFLDVSNSVRVGPVGGTALGRLVEIAAGVAQANTAERDLTGICLFDEQGPVGVIRPGRGPRHLWRLIDELTEAAGLLPQVRQARLQDLLPLAYGLAREVYPEQLAVDINRLPWWLPVWAPQPYFSTPPPPLPRIARSGLLGWLWRLPIGLWRRLLHRIRQSPLRPSLHRIYRWRKQLAALLAVHYRLGPGGLGLLLEDDDACGRYLQRFLAEHQVAHPYPLYGESGEYLFRSPEKFGVLAEALLGAVVRGKDNELFVLLADLLEAGPDLARLERAVSVARARHHQVVVICPWPNAVPLPPRSGDGPGTPSAHSKLPKPTWSLEDIVLRASTLRLHQAYAELRQRFARHGVSVLCAGNDDTVDLILYRIQQLRARERGVR
jgi:uncharacterized protein (DUF58 family)